ncbi:hypothetical protein [Flavobacterium limnosediminis]|uniref:hypothetical protein n=1 Tax=Flavobacterium limnosediminis TaxID=1401027 RepID=UPI0012DE10B4|nr:hypothetical protein [Flavobacterium limnosediminis]
MRIGIYVGGLGQSFHDDTVEKYALRIKNELNYTHTGESFDIKTEKVAYTDEKESTVVSIFKKNENDNAEEEGAIVYKLYDFKYNDILTEKFKERNILIKNLILFWLVVKKFPQIVLRLFKYNSFSRPYLTFYAFFILFIISLAILFFIPASLDIATNLSASSEFKNLMSVFRLDVIIDSINSFLVKINSPTVKDLFKAGVPITALILLIVPESKTIITSLATEFVCVDQYIENGDRSQIILGNLDLLVEYIAENEPNSKIHFHCYSFGSIVVKDLLFPVGTIPSPNLINLSKLLVTVGTPYEFVNAYYPSYYADRCNVMEDRMKWFNIYSLSDALATNFRKDSKKGDAEFGIGGLKIVPINLNYEVSASKNMNIFNFFTLYGIRVHKYYWDISTQGQSCVRLLMSKMKENDFI